MWLWALSQEGVHPTAVTAHPSLASHSPHPGPGGVIPYVWGWRVRRLVHWTARGQPRGAQGIALESAGSAAYNGSRALTAVSSALDGTASRLGGMSPTLAVQQPMAQQPSVAKHSN